MASAISLTPQALGAIPADEFSPAELGAVPAEQEDLSPQALGAVPGDAPDSEKSVIGQVVSGAALGVKKAVNPWGVTKEEYKSPQTWVETVSDAVANLATGFGAAAGVGAAAGALAGAKAGGAVGTAAGPIGTVIGATGGSLVGALVYGVYAGIGNEAMRSKAEDQEFNPLRAAANVALEVNPLVKSGKTLATLARVGAQVAGQAGVEYSYSKDPTAAAFAGGLGLVMSPILYRGMRSTDTLPPVEATQRALAQLRDTSNEGLTVRVADRLRNATKDEMTFSVDRLDDLEFQRFAVDAPAGAAAADVAKSFKETFGKLSPEQRQHTWELFKQQEFLVDEARQAAARGLTELSGTKFEEPTSALGRWVKDAKFVADDVDAKTGLNVVGTLDQFSKAKDRHDVIAGGFIKAATATKRAADRLKLSGEDIGKALAGRTSELSPAVQAKLSTDAARAVLQQWRTHFDDMYKAIRGSGHDIGYLDNYIPMTSLRGPDLVLAVEHRLAQARARATAAGSNSVLAHVDDDLKKVAEFALKKGQLTEQDLALLPKALMQAGKRDSGYEMSALFARQGEVPEFARQWDVNKLFTNYVNNTMKAVHLKDAFHAMRANVAALDALGLGESAKYFTDYMRHMSGIKDGLAAGLNTVADRMRLWGRRQESLFGDTSAAVPDFLSWASGLVYTAFLGANVKATLRNLTQAYATTAPELGGAYGYGLVTKAVLRAAKGVGSMKEYLRTKGQLGGMTSADALTDAGNLTGRVRGAIDTLNEDLLMKAYSTTDVINRYISMQAGHQWAADVIAGKPAALQALKQLQAGKKQELLASGLLQNKDVEALGDSLGDYLIGKTQFRYGKEQLSQLGRWGGPLMSMFTKWPVMVTSDMINTVKQRGAGAGTWRLMQKLALPYAALYAAHQAIEDAGNLSKTPAWDYLVSDVRSLSPLEAAFSMLAVGNNPAIAAAQGTAKFTKELIRGDKDWRDTVPESLRGITKTYVPLVAPVINEADRWYKAKGKAEYSQQITRDVVKSIGRQVDEVTYAK